MSSVILLLPDRLFALYFIFFIPVTYKYDITLAVVDRIVANTIYSSRYIRDKHYLSFVRTLIHPKHLTNTLAVIGLLNHLSEPRQVGRWLRLGYRQKKRLLPGRSNRKPHSRRQQNINIGFIDKEFLLLTVHIAKWLEDQVILF